MMKVFKKDGKYYMFKAKDLTKLVKKVIIDKNGHRKTVYVKIAEDLDNDKSVEMEKRKWFMAEGNNKVEDLVKFMRKQDIE